VSVSAWVVQTAQAMAERRAMVMAAQITKQTAKQWAKNLVSQRAVVLASALGEDSGVSLSAWVVQMAQAMAERRAMVMAAQITKQTAKQWAKNLVSQRAVVLAQAQGRLM